MFGGENKLTGVNNSFVIGQVNEVQNTQGSGVSGGYNKVGLTAAVTNTTITGSNNTINNATGSGVRISRVVYSLIDKSSIGVSHKELSCSTTYGV